MAAVRKRRRPDLTGGPRVAGLLEHSLPAHLAAALARVEAAEDAQEIAVGQFRRVELFAAPATLMLGRNHGNRSLPGLPLIVRDHQ